jgi:hypothetical protein
MVWFLIGVILTIITISTGHATALGWEVLPAYLSAAGGEGPLKQRNPNPKVGQTRFRRIVATSTPAFSPLKALRSDLVEARGVEPLSSKLSTQASTCVAGDNI